MQLFIIKLLKFIPLSISVHTPSALGPPLLGPAGPQVAEDYKESFGGLVV